MNTWADERRQGTDELLADAAGARPRRGAGQVPGRARDLFGGAAVFAAAGLRARRGWASPDLGVLFATYLGYWLMGVLLIAIGMVASMLSSNVTVAFILGALFCAVPIFLGDMARRSGARRSGRSSDGRSARSSRTSERA